MTRTTGFSILVVSFLFALPASCQQEDQVRRLQQRVRALTAQVSQLRGLVADLAEAQTQIPASNVVLEPQGHLRSSNLQDALNNELAVDLTTLLPGTTWTVANLGGSSDYSGTNGQVTFSAEGTAFHLDSGRFGPIGLVHASYTDAYCLLPAEAISYEIIGNMILNASWIGTDRGTIIPGDLEPRPQYATAMVIVHNGNSLLFIGSGGCGGAGTNRIAVLTRVTPTPEP